MDIKILFAVISVIFGVAAAATYFKYIFLRKTQPHAYTWLIWVMTTGTATAGLWYGGGGLGAVSLTLGTFFAISIFFLSLRYGTKKITRGDTIVLIAALLAILVWWQLNNPLLAVFMVSAIDAVGYLPSFRKSFEEPWSENIGSWIGFTAANLFAMLALNEYNLLTLSYLVTISTANIILISICLLRRPLIPKPIPVQHRKRSRK